MIQEALQPTGMRDVQGGVDSLKEEDKLDNWQLRDRVLHSSHINQDVYDGPSRTGPSITHH
jgi:hypothetical protein